MKESPPLSGIQVLALEQAIAAPLCTRQLAELGARVIKIERRETGDFARHYDSRAAGLSSHFVWTNRSKESLSLDLKHPASRTILDRLLESSDVLIQNLAPASARRLNLDFTQLSEEHPSLIVCNISGYGQSGPYADKKAYDLLIQAEAGFLSVTGTFAEMVKSGISIADIAAGMHAYSAILAALIQRGKTGRGSRIDVSLLDALAEWMGYPLYYAYRGAESPQRRGTDHASIYPYGVFTTADEQQLLLGVQNEREWRKLCSSVLGDVELTSDARFIDNSSRSEHREALRQIIQDVFSRHPAQALEQSLDAAAIAHARVNDMRGLWRHPQLRARGRFMRFGSPGGVLEGLAPPAEVSDYDYAVGDVPALGQHSEAILDELGFDPGEIEQMRTQEVI